MSAFSEKSLFEQGMTGSFYATGSNAWIGEEPGSFVSPLRNKEQIRLSFPVRTKVRMLPNSSSIYYFNFGAGQWNIPTASVPDHQGFGENFALDTRTRVQYGHTDNIVVGTSGSIFVEDEKWFDTHGNSLASGSLPIFRVSSLSDRRQKMTEESYEETFKVRYADWGKFLAIDFPKSVQRISTYDIQDSEYFTLPIKEPFLIEKVVFEVPFCFGNGWFNDRTLLTLMTSSMGNFFYGDNFSFYEFLVTEPVLTDDYTAQEAMNAGTTSTYNFGGPGLTLALFSEKNFGTGSIRDLVCRGFVTHDEDSRRDMKLVPMFDMSAYGYLGGYQNFWYQLTPLGFDQEDTKIDAIVSASYSGSKKFFTGSVAIKSDVEISNGVRIIHERFLKGSFKGETYTLSTFEDGINFASGVLDSKYIPFDIPTLTGIDSFGRGMTGFSPSGGSIFGSEFVSSDTNVIRKDGSIKNPSYISGSRRDQILEEISTTCITSGRFFDLVVPCYYFLGTRRQSPYLINPGEKLSLSITKNRPATLNFTAWVQGYYQLERGIGTILSSSFLMDLGDPLGHDVQLNTGSINITLYGSYVREGRKYIP